MISTWLRAGGGLLGTMTRGVLQPECPSCAAPLDLEGEALCGRCLAMIAREAADHRIRCERCHTLLTDATRPACPTCERDRSGLGRIRAGTTFCGPARVLIHGLKFDRQLPLAEPMTRFMVAAWHRYWEAHERPDAIVPVPLHWARRWTRGFNQSLVLAERIGDQLGVPVDDRLLVRNKATRQQALLGPADRAVNVADAFAVVHSAGAEGRRLLLIDDVATSGATLRACAHVLKRAGADRIDALLFARA
jgi:ComF family protein